MDFDKLLYIAKHAITSYFRREEYNPGFYGEKYASFVTLTKQKELRGCIGSLEAHRDLYLDVADNAINAAFYDPRFEPLRINETEHLEIEVSVLSKPSKFEGNDEEWIEFIKKQHPGVIIKKNGFRATFLPDVWKQLPDPYEFMYHLSIKAGLRDWRNAEKFFYTTKSESKPWLKI